MGFTEVIIIFFGMAGILAFIRMILGPTGLDRIIAADTFVYISAVIIALYSLILNEEFYLDLVLTYALLAFIGTLAIAKYVAWKER